ncbi:DNA polymerase III subunit gamma and tau [Gordonia sp. NPDC003422]
MALYRTYRPATFADVVGQEHVTDPLSRALDAGRINHAYLFSGPRGCGKTSSARILARSLNCEQGPTSTPCGVCSSCEALAPGGPGNLDVIELDAASHGGVDDTRELRDRAFYAPAESRYRVFIVDEAHMVTTAGFNALLKIVEEPPEHLIFVFATTEPEKVLPTIRSRTHHYPFRLLAPPVMRGLLENICEREHVTVAADVFPLVIRAGGGSPRDSLSVLDQLIAGADEKGVTYDRALSLLGVTDIALIDDTIDALATADGAKLFGTVEKVVDAGHDPRRFAIDLLERLRDLILLQAVPDAADRGLVEAPGDQLARMNAQIASLGSASLTRFAEIAHAALGEMRGTTSPRLLLEVMCARMLLPAVSADDAALLQRLERLESGARTSIPIPATPAEPEPEPKFVRASQRKAIEEAKEQAAAERTAAEEAEADDRVLAPAESAAPADVVVAEPADVVTPEPAPVVADTTAAEAVRGGGTPTAPQPPARTPAARTEAAPEPEPEKTPEPTPVPKQPTPELTPEPEVAAADDIPLPDEPSDDYDAPPDDPRPRLTSKAEPEPAEPPAPGLDLDTLRKRFQEVRTAVRGHSSQGKTVEPMLSSATVHDLQDQTVILSHPVEILVGRLSAPHAIAIIREAFKDVLGTEFDVQTIHQPPGGGAAPSGQARTSAKPAQSAAKSRQTYARRSQAATQTPSAATSSVESAPEPVAEPEEPEPPRADEDIPQDEREEMVADAQAATPEGRHDPGKAALELLQSELGARPLE